MKLFSSVDNFRAFLLVGVMLRGEMQAQELAELDKNGNKSN